MQEQSVTGATEGKVSKRKVVKPSDAKVYVSDSVEQRRGKFVLTLLSWRYGLKEQTANATEASVVIVNSEEEGSTLALSGKIVLPANDFGMIRRVADDHFPIVSERPTIFLPPGDDWLTNQVKRYATVVDCDKLTTHLQNLNAALNAEQRLEINKIVRRLLREWISASDYVVISERCGTLHIVVGAMASALGKPVLAEATSAVMTSIVDYFVPRREDLLSLVAMVTTVEPGV